MTSSSNTTNESVTFSGKFLSSPPPAIFFSLFSPLAPLSTPYPPWFLIIRGDRAAWGLYFRSRLLGPPYSSCSLIYSYIRFCREVRIVHFGSLTYGNSMQIRAVGFFGVPTAQTHEIWCSILAPLGSRPQSLPWVKSGTWRMNGGFERDEIIVFVED